MPADVPPALSELAAAQLGMVTRAQVLASAGTDDVIEARIRRGSWQRMYPGVYAAFSGEPGRSALLWAAVLYAGPGAMLSHQTAAELWGLAADPSSLIHVAVPGGRRVRKQAGIRLHLSVRAAAAVHPSRNPPRTRLEETVIDLWQAARNLDAAVGWLTRAIGQRLTTQDKLRQALSRRDRVRWRKELTELLSPGAAGIHSVLEYRYVRGVERPHRLPRRIRQARTQRSGRIEYRDTLYEAYRTVVELDGRFAHPGDTRWKDIHRDNAAATSGLITLRYGWRDVTTRPCAVAAEIAAVLASRGYTGARPCSPQCPVGRTVPGGPQERPGGRAAGPAMAPPTAADPARTRPAQTRPAQTRPAQTRPAGTRPPPPSRTRPVATAAAAEPAPDAGAVAGTP